MNRSVILILIGLFLACSVASAEIPPITRTKPLVVLPPAAPTGLTATVVNQKVVLTWKDNAVNETHYVDERRPAGGSFVPVMNLSAGIVQWTDAAVDFGASYVYRVQAVTLHDGKQLTSGFSNEVTVLIPFVNLTTGPLELHGIGFWPVFIQTGLLELHGK